METTELEQSQHLSEYYYILQKHRWTIIATLIAIVTLTMLFTFIMKPVYRATSTLAIENEQSTSPLTGERLDYESYMSQSLTFNTHFKLIKSRVVLENVIKDLKLDQSDDKNIEVGFFKGMMSQLKKNIKLITGKKDETVSPEERMAELAEKLALKIEIEPVSDTRLLKVNVEDPDPAMARDIANSVSKVYLQFNIDNRLKSSQSTLSWMSGQLYEVKKKLEDAEQEFLEYKQKEKIFSVEGKQKLIDQKIQDFNNSYLETRNKRLTIEAKLDELKKSLNENGNIPQIRSLLSNNLIDTLYGQMVELEVELSRLNKVYKPKHPKVVQTRTKIENTKHRIKQEIDKEVQSLEAERSVLLAQEEVIQNSLSGFENDALDTNKKELRYTILQRNVETNQKLYDTLLSKVKEANITGNIDASNLRVTEPAVIPRDPVKPKKKLNFVLSILFGLMTGAGLSFLWEYMDRSLKTEEDVKRYLELPVISVIPVLDKEKSRA